MSNPIEALKNYNINNKDIEKLKSIGIFTIQSLYMTSRKTLLNIKGFTEKKISFIFDIANKIEVYSLFQSGSDAMNARHKNIFRISTGSKNLDKILGGGLETNSLTEILGDNIANIIDIIHILCINTYKKYTDNKIIFVDLAHNYNQDKILNFAKCMKTNGKKCLENITLINDVDIYDELIDRLNEIAENDENKECSLIIIDSLIVIFQQLFRYTLSHNKQFNSEIEIKLDIESKLGKVINILKRISQLYNISIVLTRNINNNEQIDNLSEKNDLISFDSNIELILNYECKTRLKFRKIKNDIIKCRIINSPMISEEECKFIITEKGIVDC